MKNELRIHYGILREYTEQLEYLSQKIKELELSIRRIHTVLDTENEGRTIRKLRVNYEQLEIVLAHYKTKISFLEESFRRYLDDMIELMYPDNMYQMTVLSSEGIYTQFSELQKMLEHYIKRVRGHFSWQPFVSKEFPDQAEREYLEYKRMFEQFEDQFDSVEKRLIYSMEELWNIYNVSLLQCVTMDEEHADRFRIYWKKY